MAPDLVLAVAVVVRVVVVVVAVVVAVVGVELELVALHERVHIGPNMFVHLGNCYRFHRIRHSRIGDNGCPSCRSTNEPRSSDNFQLQLPCNKCLWLIDANGMNQNVVEIRLTHSTGPKSANVM